MSTPGRGGQPARLSARARLSLAALLVAAAVLYFAGLGWSPPYLSIEEVAVVQQAFTLAETGRDDSGHWLPLYITEGGSDPGGGPHDPMWVHAGAALLKVAPFSEALMRVPSVLAGIAGVLLMFLVARRVFASDGLALMAAAILALTPAHFMQSRIASQQIGPVPFMLLWLLFFLRYLDSRRPRELVLASLSLGIGTYSYIAAAVFLPCCFLAMLAALMRYGVPAEAGVPGGVTVRLDLALSLAGFSAALVPMVVWHLVYPERLVQLADYYTHHGYNADLGGSGVFSSRWIVSRLDLWWNTLNPERLLFIGDSDYRYSTRNVGHLLLPMAIPIAIGALQFRRFVRPELCLVTAIVFVLSPLPAIAAGDVFIKRWLPLLPFFALLATAGFAALIESRRRVWRGVAAAVGIVAIVQFAGFLRYYHGGYRDQANFYFDGNIHGFVREVLASTDDPACALIDRRIDVRAQWRLYARAAGASGFADRVNAVDAEHPDFSSPASCRRSSVVVLEGRLHDNPEFGPRLEAAGWQRIDIPEPEGKTVYVVYRRATG